MVLDAATIFVQILRTTLVDHKSQIWLAHVSLNF